MKKRGEKHFVVCARDRDHKASLEIERIYLAIPDNTSAELGLIRNTT